MELAAFSVFTKKSLELELAAKKQHTGSVETVIVNKKILKNCMQYCKYQIIFFLNLIQITSYIRKQIRELPHVVNDNLIKKKDVVDTFYGFLNICKSEAKIKI